MYAGEYSAHTFVVSANDGLRGLPRKWRCVCCPMSKVNSISGSLASNWSSHSSAYSRRGGKSPPLLRPG
jgi:hypothetical protein